MKLDKIELLPPEGALGLAPAPESQRVLTESNGSFGGRTIPANVALGPDGSIYLLDTQHYQLKRFDPCECKFQAVPCFGGAGRGSRQLNDAHGIGISAGDLFVCDTGNRRVSVFALRSFVLRGHLQPPATDQQPDPQLSGPWEPYDLAFDRLGRVYVTDSANGCIHRFNRRGRWEKCFAGFGKVKWIAIDRQDRIVVVVAGVQPSVRVISPDKDGSITDSLPEEETPLFPPTPFQLDTNGLLHLGELCSPADEGGCNKPGSPLQCPPDRPPKRGLFDLQGNVVERCATPAATCYERTGGVYYSKPLDSEIYRCQWHRVILRGEIPAGTSVKVSTYSAEALLIDDQIRGLGDNWETNRTASDIQNGEWDCLVMSGGGRYLWLKLDLFGNDKATPRIDSVELEFPRISLRRYLPAVFGEEPVSADFTDRFLSLFDTILRGFESKLDRQAGYFDPRSTPANRDPKTGNDFLSWLASWIGLTMERSWPEAKRRNFLKEAPRLYDLRGTRDGLWRELLLLLEIDPNACWLADQPQTKCGARAANCAPVAPPVCGWRPPPLILEHFKLRRWLFLGEGRLGDQTKLWGKRIVNRSLLDNGAQIGHTQLLTMQDPARDPFHFYAHKFTVFIPARCRDSESHRKALENIVRSARPASTLARIEYVEPRFRIGVQSMIGLDSVIGRYPAGVTLNKTSLGQAAVLTAPPHKEGGPSLEIGKRSRIGSTTKLE